jgi:hypothetical protein
MSDSLDVRFDRIRHDRKGDWQDVVRRAGGRRRRRRLAVATVLAAVVALGAPTALALRGSVVDFFQSEPASNQLVLDFARMDVGAPPGLENHVNYAETRKIFERKLANGTRLTLWVAPNGRGGYCTALVGPHNRGGFGCLWEKRPPISPGIGVRGSISPEGVIRGGPVLVSGSVGHDQAETIELHYRDGDVDRQTLTWVSSPIDAGFFLFEVPQRHWGKDHQFDRLVLRDADGRALYSEAIALHLPLAMDPKTGAPSEALQAHARRLIEITTHAGVVATLWTAPTADGRPCYWLRYGDGGSGGGCSPSSSDRRPLAAGQSQGGGVVLLWGGPLQEDVARIDIRFEDGDRAAVPVTEGMVLYEIPPEYFPRGHRPELLIARDADGKELARRRQETKVYGAYPCAKPVAIPKGFGEQACP